MCGLFLFFEWIPVLDHVINTVTGESIPLACQSVMVQQEHVDVAVVLSMLSVQVLRRLYECLCVSVFSDARIHLFHYALGMLYYPMVAFTALLHLRNIKHSSESSVSSARKLLSIIPLELNCQNCGVIIHAQIFFPA